MESYSYSHLREMLSMIGILREPSGIQEMMANMNRMKLTGGRSHPEDEDFQAQFERVKTQVKSEKDLPPERVFPLSPIFLVQALSGLREKHIQFDRKGSVRTTYVGMPRTYSCMRLSQLRRVSIFNMYVRKTHKGQFLLCRTISPPVCTVSVTVVVEDPEGFVVQLFLYNFPGMTDAIHDELDRLLPKGTILAIKEPTYKFSLNGTAQMVRVDSPSDVIFLPNGSSYLRNVSWSSNFGGLPPNIKQSSVDQCLSRGRYEFQLQRWLIAAVLFSEGLRLDPTHTILRLNRAQCYLRFGWYNATLADIEEVHASSAVLDSSLQLKASFRAAKAHYMLGNYLQAIADVESYTENEECATLTGKARQRLIEQSTGNYDWTVLFKESLKKCSRLDIANYTGPIEVTMNDRVGGGRGIFITRDVLPGELLLVEKPIASCYDDDFKTDVHLITFNFLTNTLLKRTQVAVLHKVVERLWDDPELDHTLRSMYAGPSFNPPSAWRIYSSPNPSFKLKHHPLEPAVDIDITRIEAVCFTNSFAANQIIRLNHFLANADDAMEACQGTVLYGLPSLINHACQPSAYWHTWGDVIVIRTARAMKKGEEVRIPYVPSLMSFTDRAKNLSKRNFDCQCILCEADRTDGVSERAHREEDFAHIAKVNIDSAIRLTKAKIKSIEKTYNRSQATYSSFVHKPSLLYAHSFLGSTYLGKAESNSHSSQSIYVSLSLKEKMKSLELGGLIILDESISGIFRGSSAQKKVYMPIDTENSQCHHDQMMLVFNALHITYTFVHFLEDPARGRAWLNVALWICHVHVGGNEDFFKMLYEKIIEQFRLTDFIQSIF